MAALCVAGSVFVAAASSAAPATVGTPRPDLVVREIRQLPVSATIGRTFRVRAVVQERLRVRAPGSTTRFYLSADLRRNAADVRMGQVATPALRGASTTVIGALAAPARVAAGRYFLFACSDDLRIVRETSESNNCHRSVARIRFVKATDTTAPSAPSKPMTTPAGSGSESAPLVSGTAEANSTVRIFHATSSPSCSPVASALASTVASTTGAWAVKAPAIAAGASIQYAATATDAAGNVGPCSVASDTYTFVPSTTPTSPTPASATINPVGLTWSPTPLAVAAGTTVTFNHGTGHTVVSDGPSSFPNSGAGASYAHTFSASGTYDYHCSIHGSPGAGMHGQITVA